MRSTLTKFAIPALLAFAGCNDDAPLGPDHVDPRLLGSWYYVSTAQRTPFPAPSHSYYGMRIDSDKTIEYLGIEVSTGKLAVLENTERSSMLRASDGVLVLQSYAMGELITDNLNYSFEGNTLLLRAGDYTATHLRAELGAVVAAPVQSEMDVSIDGYPGRVPTVSASVPIYSSEIGAAQLRFFGHFEGGLVSIDIESFAGVGSYPLGTGDGILQLFYGDVSEHMETRVQDPGTIDIDQYDAASGRCSGRFAFTVYHNSEYGARAVSGTFDAPQYVR